MKRRIDSRFWSDNLISDLAPLDKLLFLYFLTNDKVNMVGIYELPLKVAAVETGININDIAPILPKISSKIAYHDGWVYILNYVRYQNVQNSNMFMGMFRTLNELPQNVKNKAMELGCSLPNEPRMDAVPTIPYLTIPNLTIPIGSSRTKKRMFTNDQETAFQKFYSVYPRKQGKERAVSAFIKIAPDETLVDIMISAIKKQAQSQQWQSDGGKYIPMPATWLNGRRWEDEVINNIDAGFSGSIASPTARRLQDLVDNKIT